MVQTHADYVWTPVAAALVFFMQAGFAMVEAGTSLNGALAGLVAITNPCATVAPTGAAQPKARPPATMLWRTENALPERFKIIVHACRKLAEYLTKLTE